MGLVEGSASSCRASDTQSTRRYSIALGFPIVDSLKARGDGLYNFPDREKANEPPLPKRDLDDLSGFLGWE
jgi:hypothetical protein